MQLDLLEEEAPPIVRQERIPPILTDIPAKRSKPMSHVASPVATKEPPHMEDDDVLVEDKAPSAFRTISEVASFLSVPQHVLRFWESRFSQIKPLKSRGGRRYYRPEDVETLTTIKNLLYKQGYTIKGAKQAFRGQAPVIEEVAEEPATKAVSDKQLSQLAVIRQELIVMRDVLKPYVF